MANRAASLARSALLSEATSRCRSTSVALAWARSISDPDAREYSVNALLSEWSKRDLWSAMDYLYNSPELPSEMRDKLIHSLTQLGKIPALE